jgi:hypothetical protein
MSILFRLEVSNYSERKSIGMGEAAYGSTKLMNVLFAKRLHAREAANGVAVCSPQPGSMIATDVARGTEHVATAVLWAQDCGGQDGAAAPRRDRALYLKNCALSFFDSLESTKVSLRSHAIESTSTRVDARICANRSAQCSLMSRAHESSVRLG